MGKRNHEQENALSDSKRQNTHNISIAKRDDLDEQLFSRPAGHNTFKGSSNKRLQFNQDEDEQASVSELKRKNSGNFYFKFVNSPGYRNISFENDSNEQVVADDKSRNINNLLRNQLLRNITFLKYELKQVLSNQTVMLDKLDQMEKCLEQNSFNKPVMEVNGVDFSDCPLPINNIYDLQTFEDKISGDQSYKNQLVFDHRTLSYRRKKCEISCEKTYVKTFSRQFTIRVLLYRFD
ncbi:uncharacterized protein LOC100573725 [Acyrthosiphon pisum]|uniref:Uncharacterized protein n=1 Tax=Acyrthosiphon pisum TaxID=7029 RepID=A0A8R2JMG6_ACYPI|nr:uncharacterized protein LOC100573725 [Acyrthosiphon pisum]